MKNIDVHKSLIFIQFINMIKIILNLISHDTQRRSNLPSANSEKLFEQ